MSCPVCFNDECTCLTEIPRDRLVIHEGKITDIRNFNLGYIYFNLHKFRRVE